MIEVAPRLFVGSQTDYETQAKDDNSWTVVQACKEPYHRAALGYTGRAARNDHPEYLFCKRDNRLILNLVDVDDPQYVRPEIIDAALACIHLNLSSLAPSRQRVLVHCNQGRSRSPTIAMLHLAKALPVDFERAEEAFAAIYPDYAPANGMREFARGRWPTLHTQRAEE